MKRRRLFLGTITCVLLVIAFCGWWVTWPDRTIKQFIQLLRADKFDEMSGMMATQEDREFVAFMKNAREMEEGSEEPSERQSGPIPEFNYDVRSAKDILFGRAFYYRMDAGFYVQRGMVSFEPFDAPPQRRSDIR